FCSAGMPEGMGMNPFGALLDSQSAHDLPDVMVRHSPNAALAGIRHLREILSKYVDYENGTRTRIAVEDAPKPRTVLPSQGGVVKVPRVGGLHHKCRRRAA